MNLIEMKTTPLYYEFHHRPFTKTCREIHRNLAPNYTMGHYNPDEVLAWCQLFSHAVVGWLLGLASRETWFPNGS
jgi:hypothetical protein